MKKWSYLLSLIILSGCNLYTTADIEPQQYAAFSDISNQEITESDRSKGFQVLTKVEDPKFWDRMELVKATDSNIPDEKMHQRGRQRDPDIVKCFGNDTPSSKYFCLHDMGEPKELKHETPVLLVHGANTTATRAWADPEGDGKKTGLAQHLKNEGFRVFAVTFANKHGDNYIWASHIHRAITRIKELTKVEKVDTLGHSKGGFSLRLYTSNVNNGTFSYGNDVRKAIFVGSPHRGIDYSFRHPSAAWAIYPDNDDPVKYAPFVWTKLMWMGSWKDAQDWSMSGDYFKGQAQMVARWDKKYPLSVVEPDWMTTYYGGKGFVSESPGIDEVIKSGGNLVEKLKTNPVVPSIKVAVLAGDMPTVPGILNENTGPSDGVLFVESGKYGPDISKNLLASEVMHLNHLALVSNSKAMNWIEDQFASK